MRASASSPHTASLELCIRPRTVGVALGCTIALLVAIGLAGQIAKYELGHDHLLGLVPLFNLDGEANVPTWYSAAVLLCSSALLGMIGRLRWRERDRFAAGWVGLSALFLYVSVDEAAFMHELLNPLVARAVKLPPYFAFGWVVVAIPVLLLLGVGYARFFAALPPRTRRWFFFSALVYLGGGLGVEMIGAFYAVTRGGENLTYAVIATMEETMEMAGVGMFVYALLDYLAGTAGAITFHFDRRTDR